MTEYGLVGRGTWSKMPGEEEAPRACRNMETSSTQDASGMRDGTALVPVGIAGRGKVPGTVLLALKVTRWPAGGEGPVAESRASRSALNIRKSLSISRWRSTPLSPYCNGLAMTALWWRALSESKSTRWIGKTSRAGGAGGGLRGASVKATAPMAIGGLWAS